jgi:hypothetical protein
VRAEQRARIELAQPPVTFEAPRDHEKDLVGHHAQGCERLVRVVVAVEIHLGEAVEPNRLPRVEQHRDLHAVAGRERESLEQPLPRRDLARQRLTDPGELGIEDRERRAREQVVDAATPFGQLDLADTKRAAVVRLDELDVGRLEQRADEAGDEMGLEVGDVRVEEADDLACEHAERAPHRIALAKYRTEIWKERGLFVNGRAGAPGDVPRGVARVAVDYDDLIDQTRGAQLAQALDDRTHGRGAVAGRQADGDPLTALTEELRAEA